MPPPLSAHEAAARERALCCIDVVAVILSFLPLRDRVACAAVRAQWRAALRERSAWTRLLQLEPGSSDAALRAAAHKAEGLLEALDVAGSPGVTPAALLAAVAANAGALRELRGVGAPYVYAGADDSGLLRNDTTPETLDELRRAAPRLRVLHASVQCDGAEARRLLSSSSAPPYERVVRVLELFLCDHDELHDDELAATLACVSAHAPLTRLILALPLWRPAALDAVVDLALARRLTALTFYQSRLGGDWGAMSVGAPAALARLLDGGALAELHLRQEHSLAYEAQDLAPLCAALRRSTAQPHTGRHEPVVAPCRGVCAAGRARGTPHAAHAQPCAQRRLPRHPLPRRPRVCGARHQEGGRRHSRAGDARCG
jgi:hypothetical protein